MRKLFDPKCADLAHDFIDDHPHLRPMAGDLAMSIQAAIDIWIDEQNALRAYLETEKTKLEPKIIAAEMALAAAIAAA